jgi:hypothetical protein
MGTLKVDRLNAAGLFMAVAWLIFVLVCLAVFEDVSGEWNNLTEHVNISGQWHDGFLNNYLQSGSERLEEGPLGTSLANPSNTAMLSICDSVKTGPPETFLLPTWSDGTKYFWILIFISNKLFPCLEMFQDTMIALMGAIFTIYFDEIVIEASHDKNKWIHESVK